MRDDLKKKLTVNRAKLVKGLDVTGSFFSELSSNGAITEEHLAIVKAERTPHEQVDKLIDILLRRPDGTFDLFCDVVKINNPDMFDLISNGSGSTDAAVKGDAKNGPVNSRPQDAQLKNEELKIKTQRCYSKINSTLDPRGHVVDTLFERGVITSKEHKEIRDGPDQETRAGCFLSHLFTTSHPQAFVVFREALEKEYDWMVKMLDE